MAVLCQACSPQTLERAAPCISCHTLALPTPCLPSCQVNTLLPGAINTPFLNTMLANPRKLEYILGRIPLGALKCQAGGAGGRIAKSPFCVGQVRGNEPPAAASLRPR